MRLEHSIRIPAAQDDVWTFLMDVPAVARCMPGVGSVEPLGEDRYRGTLGVKIGPVQLSLQGDVSFTERDQAAGTAKMSADAKDARLGGGLRATVLMRLLATAERETELALTTDTQLLGRLGELGQPIIRRKADQLMERFAENLRAAIGAGGAGG